MSSKTTTDSSAADQLWVFTHNGGRVRGDQLVALSIEERSYEPGEPRVAIMGRVSYDPELRVILARFDTEAEARDCLETSRYFMSWAGLDLGRDALSPVSDAYTGEFPFTGTVDRVEFRLADDTDGIGDYEPQD